VRAWIAGNRNGQMSDLEQIRERCIAAGYHAEIRNVDTDDPRRRQVAFWYGDGDSESGRVIVPAEAAPVLLGTKFDDYRPLGDFEAIWSHALGTIECALNAGNLSLPPAYRLEAIARRLGQPGDFDEMLAAPVKVTVPLLNDRYRVSLQLSSVEFGALRGLFRRQGTVRFEQQLYLPVLRLEGLAGVSEAEAEDILERVGNAVLFQVDLKTDVPLFLARRRELLSTPSRVARERLALAPQAFQYDAEPMALYWYARTAFQIPLLGFLGFYQVVEFYFPSFSSERAQVAVRNILKDPRFDCNNDSHITRLLSAVRPSVSGRGYGDERAQLQATVQACVTPQQMREFMESSDQIVKFYSRQQKKMPIVDVRVPIDSEDADLRPQVALRIYAIRNRIVHTKAGDEAGEVLLPFSREVRLLRYDLQLMEFIARQTLITTSRPLQI
jgi:hypothetical protein